MAFIHDDLPGKWVVLPFFFFFPSPYKSVLYR